MDVKPVGIFEGFSPGDLKRVGKQMREIKHAQGAEIMIKGEGGVGFLVILEGEAEVATPDGRHRKRSEEHTSELQSHLNLVCRLLLEKKKKTQSNQALNINREA